MGVRAGELSFITTVSFFVNVLAFDADEAAADGD
jgi:hypothetical protein